MIAINKQIRDNFLWEQGVLASPNNSMDPYPEIYRVVCGGYIPKKWISLVIVRNFA